jgi:3-oxoacyl-[acyl-carrier-protein] synthase-3
MSSSHEVRLHGVTLAGIGAYAPERILTNADLEKMVDTTDEWIFTRTGIRERHIAAGDEVTSDLGVKAARRAIEEAGVTPDHVQLIIVATTTPDMIFPSTACQVQQKLGALNAAAFDLSAACSGFLYSLQVARQFIASGTYENVLVIGAEKLSTITDWKDRNTCVLFGDAAGAALLRRSHGETAIRSIRIHADGRHGKILQLPAGGAAMPASEETIATGQHFIQMSGREVFKLAVVAMQNAAMEAIGESGLTMADIAWVIPHQANIRIIEAIAERLGVGLDKFIINVDKHGNTSAASIPLAMCEAVRDGRIKRGDHILMVAFGGGLTWASAVITY